MKQEYQKEIKPNKKYSVILVIVILLFLILFSVIVYFYSNNREYPNPEKLSENQKKCIELGCEKGAKFVGSINSDKYYLCTCYYADRIKKENLVCFNSEKIAESTDRVRSEC